MRPRLGALRPPDKLVSRASSEAEEVTHTALRIAEVLERLRTEGPVVHHITNDVAMAYTADVTRQLGARPVMATAAEEVAEIVAQARALVLNLGTPSRQRLRAMRIAAVEANRRSIPIVFDPVGVGASRFRTTAAARLIERFRMAVVRGNVSEIAVLSGSPAALRGVDAAATSADGARAAQSLAARHHAVVAVTGAADLVTDSRRALSISNGVPTMAQVVGTGCMSTAAIACCAAVESDYLLAAAAGLVFSGLAGEAAAEAGAGPGGFRAAMLDALAGMTSKQVVEGAKLQAEVMAGAVSANTESGQARGAMG